jgi:methylenetetrahydrofolate reductase (NADPH)
MSLAMKEYPHATAPWADLLDGFSLEMTAKDIPSLNEAAPLIPKGTRISVTFLPNEAFEDRVAAAAAVRRHGFVPIPHLSARRIGSERELDDYLARLSGEAGIDHAFVIAGDPPEPLGPYEDALAILKSGLLSRHGVKHVGISGYPEGHPDIDDAKLWAALSEKSAVIEAQDQQVSIITQFGFDADPVLSWLEKVRQAGVTAPVRAGVAGPANVKTLLRFAARCGVGASAKVMKKYGLSLTKVLGTAGPDPIIKDLHAGLDAERHGAVSLHFYPFGGLARTSAWIDEQRAG